MKCEEMKGAVKEHKIIAIMRGLEKGQALLTAEALFCGGIRCLEVTYNQRSMTKLQDTKHIISELKQRYGERMLIGAGTVMSVAEVQASYECGASFVLAPNVDRSVIEEAVRLQIPAVPGAMTPSEIIQAHAYGAALVKLFPAGELGNSYCKAVLSPINHIPMIAVGGIDRENLAEYLGMGFAGAGIGSSLTDRDMIREERYEELEELARQFVNKTREAD